MTKIILMIFIFTTAYLNAYYPAEYNSVEMMKKRKMQQQVETRYDSKDSISQMQQRRQKARQFQKKMKEQQFQRQIKECNDNNYASCRELVSSYYERGDYIKANKIALFACNNDLVNGDCSRLGYFGQINKLSKRMQNNKDWCLSGAIQCQKTNTNGICLYASSKCQKLAMYYLKSEGDVIAAKIYLKKACNASQIDHNSNPSSCSTLTNLSLFDVKDIINDYELENKLKRKCNNHNILSCQTLINLYLNIDSIVYNKKKAIEVCKSKCTWSKEKPCCDLMKKTKKRIWSKQ